MHEQLTPDPVPYGFCHCRCGGRTTIATASCASRGIVRGEPRKYIHGHNTRGVRKVARYVEEDRGYLTPCWVWQLCLNPEGYGHMRAFGTGRSVLAHRWYYEQTYGEIQANLTLDHLCRVRACVNPAHLEPVTNAENNRRGNNTKLTREAVEAIRYRYAAGEHRDKLAAEHGVDESVIRAAVKGKTWRDVGGPIATPRRYQRRSTSSSVSGG